MVRWNLGSIVCILFVVLFLFRCCIFCMVASKVFGVVCVYMFRGVHDDDDVDRRGASLLVAALESFPQSLPSSRIRGRNQIGSSSGQIGRFQ